jgi:hypothetical protein
MLNTGEHVASPANMRTLMLIISEQSAYTEGLEASIKCFLSTDAPKSEGGL